MTATAALACPKCAAPIPEPRDGGAACPACGAMAEWTLFPALWRAAPAPLSAPVAAVEAATCFHHPARPAERICDACGRFLCGLCGVDYHGEHLCPACIAAGASARELRGRRHVRHDRIALHLALLSLLMFPLAVFVLPTVLYLAFRHGLKPTGYLPRRRWEFPAAVAIALVPGGLLLLAFATLALE